MNTANTVRTYSYPVSDGFCVIIGRCRINDEAAHFAAGINLSSYKLVIVSDPLPSFGFVMPSALRFFFIIGQLEEFSNKSCRQKKTTQEAFYLYPLGLNMSLAHNEAFSTAFTVISSNCGLSNSECKI